MEHQLEPNVLLVQGKPVYFFESKSECDEVIVLLHGFMSDYRSIEPFASNLKTDARILLPDLPGFGASPYLNSDTQLEQYAEWLRDFIDQACPTANKVTIMGYSFGAYIAILFASKYPKAVHELVLITPVIKIAWPVLIYGKWFNSLASISEFIAKKLYTWGPGYDFTTHYLRKARHPELKQRLIDHRRTELEYLNPELVLSLVRQFKEIDLVQYAPTLHVPVSVVLASKDNVANNKQTSEFIAGLEIKPVVVELEKAGHLVPFEEPHVLSTAVNAIRRQVSAQAE